MRFRLGYVAAAWTLGVGPSQYALVPRVACFGYVHFAFCNFVIVPSCATPSFYGRQVCRVSLGLQSVGEYQDVPRRNAGSVASDVELGSTALTGPHIS